MPKDNSERIIDWPYQLPTSRLGSIAIGGGGGDGGGGGGATTLDGLSDVTVSAPSNGQVLSYNSGTGQWGNAAGGGLTAHGLSSSFHTGLLNWDLIDFAGSRLEDMQSRQHNVLMGMTPDDHHNQAHVLATGTALGDDHTISGAAAGQVLRASDADSAAFDVLQHTDLGNILPDQHHAQVHLLADGFQLGDDHTIEGGLPGYVLRATSSSAARLMYLNHTDLEPSSITADQHHYEDHVLITGTALGAHHTISGGVLGAVLRATSATQAQLMQLPHQDLDNVLPDQHHPRMHNIITGDPVYGAVHTITGIKLDLVGAINTDTLGLIQPSSAPGSTERVLKTDIYGGIQLDTDLLYVDAANNRVGINHIPDTPPGAATLSMRAANLADHTQRIKQIVGQTGRLWRIEDTAGDELIVLDSVGNLQSGYSEIAGSPGFVSGLLGWRITPQGNAEFNNIWARGELHATVFVKDEVHATGGTFLVASAGTLHDSVLIQSGTTDDEVLYVKSTAVGFVPLEVVTTSPTFVGNQLHVSWVSNVLNIDDPASGPAFYFQPGDVIRAKTEIEPTPPDTLRLSDLWFEVSSAVQNDGYASYSVIKRAGSDTRIPKGTALVSYGKEGDGRILFTSDLQYAPYMDVFTTGYQVWTGAAGSVIPRVRLGRLDGIGVPGVSGVEQYGMIAGSNLSDANSGYFIASNLQFSLYKINMRLNNGTNDTGLWTADGNLRIGANIGADATTGFRVYTTAGGGFNPGDVVIGNTATGNYLRWTQASGILQVAGSLVVSDPGTTVTKTYVDSQDVYYDNLANLTSGYAGQAQTNAQAYSEVRRIVGVTGTWTPSANQIAWSGLSAVIANGGSRSIADGTSGAMGARTYLWTNVTLTGTLTLSATTSPSTIATQPGRVLIAVCDPGAPMASVSVVAGSTYISGTNIATGSITANNIAALTITAAQIAAHTITANEIEVATLTTVSDDAAAAAGQYRTLAIDGTFQSNGPNNVSWGAPTNVTVRKANNVTITVTDGSLTATSTPNNFDQRLYLYINESDGSPTTMKTSPTIGGLPANAIMIAVITPGTTGTGGSGFASIVLVNGGVLISGDGIVANSIHGDKIVGGSISSTKVNPTFFDGLASDYAPISVVTDYQTYVNQRRIVGVSGTWRSIDDNHIGWGTLLTSPTGVITQAKLANGDLRTITSQASHLLAGGPGTRHFLYVDVGVGGTGAMPIIDTTAIDAMGVNDVLIAVVDVGKAINPSDPDTSGSDKATIQIMAGSTYISGDNILTGSVTATQIQAGAITTGLLAADVVTSIAAADKKRVAAISGKFDSDAWNRVDWGSFSIEFGDGSNRNVAASAGITLTGAVQGDKSYLVVNPVANAAPATLTITQVSQANFATLTADQTVVAVCERGVNSVDGRASIMVVAGGTYISGSNIITRSIKADNLVAGTITGNEIAGETITADLLKVGKLEGINGTAGVTTGNLTVDGKLTVTGAGASAGAIEVSTDGNIHSAGKTYGASAKGFWLGYTSGATPIAQFDIGDDDNYLRWTGSALALRMAQGIDITSVSTNLLAVRDAVTSNIVSRLFYFANEFQFSHSVRTYGLALGQAADGLAVQVGGSGASAFFYTTRRVQVNGSLEATSVIASDGRIRIAESSAATTPDTMSSSPGTIGDMIWGSGSGVLGSPDYLYVYTKDGWKRVLLSYF